MSQNAPPDLQQARIRAYQLLSQGRAGEAAEAYDALVQRDPRDFESWNNLGNARRAAGDSNAAVAALEQATALRPDLPMLRLNLAGALLDAGRAEDSAAMAAEAARLAPEDLSCLVEASRAQQRAGANAGAIGLLERAVRLLPGHPALQVELGLARAAAGDHIATEAAYREALRLQPDFAPAFLYLGILLEHSNRSAELPALVDEADAHGVDAPEMGLLRAYVLKRQGDVAGVLAAVQAVPSHFEPMRRAQLIGEMLDRIGDSKAAFAAFTEMNRLAASCQPGSREAAARYRVEIEALLALTTPAWRASWTGSNPPPERPAPILLMGFPRSGTTLLDTVLMGHSRLHVVEEKPLLEPVLAKLGGMDNVAALDDEGLKALRCVYFDALEAQDPAPPGKLVVDKMPLNIPRLPLIHRLFPEARVVLALRHPCDVVLSCYITSFSLNYAMANFLDLKDAARLYDLVMRYWERCREVLALDVHEIRYEAMIEDLESSVGPLLAGLGLESEAAMLDHRGAAASRGYVRSASYAQVTQPLYTRAQGRWQLYRSEMAEVLPILAPWVEKLGYTL
jgi:tetratricopeptide (TPR) repeat protein